MKKKFIDYILKRENSQVSALPVQTLDNKSSALQIDSKYPALSQQMPPSVVSQNQNNITDKSMKDRLEDEQIKKTFTNHISKAFDELSKSKISPEKSKKILTAVVQEMIKVTGIRQSQIKNVVDKMS